MSIRLHFIVEGPTEEAFVNQTLRPHLVSFSIWASARSVEMSRKQGRKHSGGIVNYAKPRKDIIRWLRQDQNSDARFTTMFDLYSLPDDFPGYADAARASGPYERVRILEDALGNDISDFRFIPYIQLHEFEALVLADPQKLDSQYYDRSTVIRSLVQMAAQFLSPELINDGEDTAPSKRITAAIPGYRKKSAGPLVAEQIGLPTLRSRCPHFGEWLGRLEALSADI